MSQWNNPYALLVQEFTQRRDEGAVIPKALRDGLVRLDPVVDAWNEPAIAALAIELAAIPSDPVLAAAEPNDLAAIRALRPAGPRSLQWNPSDAQLLDRLHGAWTGRATGCALGKPVEMMGMGIREGALCGRSDIKRYLSARGDWPLRDYFSGRNVGDGLTLWCPRSTREEIAYMEPDDDIHYTMVGLGVLEDHGPDFTWDTVAEWWMAHIPMRDLCTAETQAMMNYMSRTSRLQTPGVTKSVATPEFCRRNQNPYREWIGAQIRADGWAFACAGNPELAAEFAYRDACWTHERNGIYGAMFFAAIQAAAFAISDPADLVSIGLSEIPEACRLAQTVRQTLEICDATSNWEAAMEQLETLTNLLSPPIMSPVHTINNAALCVLAMMYARIDSVNTITTAVMAGLDTDCNGATIGSIVGAAIGRRAFRGDLADRLNDTIRPNLIGFQEVTMLDLASRTAAQWNRVRTYAEDRTNRSL